MKVHVHMSYRAGQDLVHIHIYPHKAQSSSRGLAYLLDNGAVLSHGEELPVAHNVPAAKVVHIVAVASSLDAEVLATPKSGGCSARAAHADLGGIRGPRGVGGLLVAPTLSACEAHPASATEAHMRVLQRQKLVKTPCSAYNMAVSSDICLVT